MPRTTSPSPWTGTAPLYLKPPRSFQADGATTAIEKMIVMGANADAVLLTMAAEANHKAILNIGASKNGAASRAAWGEVVAALGRVIASAPEETVTDVYNAIAAIAHPGVPAYLKSMAKGSASDAACAGFLEFRDVVRASQTSQAVGSIVAKGDAIGAVAEELSEASHRFLKEIDWKSDLCFQPPPWGHREAGSQGRGQGHCHGLEDWRQDAQGRCRGVRLGPHEHGRQRRDLPEGLNDRQRGHRANDRFHADLEGDGRVRRFRWRHRARSAWGPDVRRRIRGRQQGARRFPRVRRRCQGGAGRLQG
ncbi:unnamed protein product [Prorocentrum cordatum]|uniref:Uncharacterized protein n=1 Tax=Prorocentrum cordatum TaxID=2364126 RepID=A0ABN9S8H3_9DINO|nr:unnamed protein product [Polarella glacialis]